MSRMINPFQTTYLAIVAYAVLRVFLGLILMRLGYLHLTRDAGKTTAGLRLALPTFSRAASGLAVYLGIIEIVIGAMFTAGLYTQIAAIAGVFYALKMLWCHKHLREVLPSPSFYVLMIGVSITLFITGAGILAFDIPL
jgi:uncharacterized membrane protein YphA (DoxX/SURF4 family)